MTWPHLTPYQAVPNFLKKIFFRNHMNLNSIDADFKHRTRATFTIKIIKVIGWCMTESCDNWQSIHPYPCTGEMWAKGMTKSQQSVKIAKWPWEQWGDRHNKSRLTMCSSHPQQCLVSERQDPSGGILGWVWSHSIPPSPRQWGNPFPRWTITLKQWAISMNVYPENRHLVCVT